MESYSNTNDEFSNKPYTYTMDGQVDSKINRYQNRKKDRKKDDN